MTIMEPQIERQNNGHVNDTMDLRTNGDSRRRSLTLPVITGTHYHYQNACYYHISPHAERILPDLLPVEQITILYYASAIVLTDGTVTLQNPDIDVRTMVGLHKGYLRACLALKQRNQALKVLLSIGGDQSAANFSSASAHADSRETFARSAVSLVDQYGLDGIDVNWKKPLSHQDGDRLVALLEQTRGKMASGLTLTTSLPPRKFDLEKIQHLRTISQVVDYVNLNCYDFETVWVDGRENSSHQSQLYSDVQHYHTVPDQEPSIHDAVAYLKNRNRMYPPKILLGIPTHGWAFKGASTIGQSYHVPALNIPYHALPPDHASEEMDPKTKATYCYGTEEGFISYDNPQSVWKKGQYLKYNKLGGLFFSNAASDKRGEESLIKAGFEVLTTLKP